tara:strand:- start:962 stop:1255 length:294 start_codon:yes stop_codon:yes gene_type:complete
VFNVSVSLPKEPIVSISTTQNRGFTPEEVAQRCVNKIINVSDQSPPAIRDQANAFKNNVEKIIAHYMHEAIKSDRTTVYNAIKDAGHPKLAELIRRL